MEKEPVKESSVDFLYCNGFRIEMGAGDCIITLQVGPDPTLAVCLSHHAAKSLALRLNSSLKIIEDLTGSEIPDLEKMNKLILSRNEEPKK